MEKFLVEKFLYKKTYGCRKHMVTDGYEKQLRLNFLWNSN